MLSGESIRADMEAASSSQARPQPLPLIADKGKQEPYPVDALGPILGPATLATSRSAYVPISLAAQSIVSAVSLAIQAHFDVTLPPGGVRPTSIFATTVAESGDRKSTSDDQAMAPVWKFQNDLEEEFADKKFNAQLAQAAWDESKKATTQTLKSKGRAALEQGYRELGERPAGPLDPTIVIRTGTTQGLLKRLMTSRPSLGLMSDEGGSWLGGFGMTEDNRLHTISVLSDFWDGKAIQTNTAGEGFIAFRGCRLTFHLMIQPVLAGRLLGNAEAQGQGFLSRLLVAHPESIAGSRFVDPSKRGGAEDDAAVAAYRDRLDTILRKPLPLKPDTNCLDPRALVLSPQATAMWWDFYNSIEARVGIDGDLVSVKGFAGKLPEQAARLAALIGIFNQEVRGDEIGAESLARGIALAEFYLSEAVRLFGHASPDAQMQDAKLLSDWIAAKWKENLISVTAILQSGPSRVRQGGDYVRALIDILVRHDHLSPKLPNGGMVSGRQVREAWRVIVGRG